MTIGDIIKKYREDHCLSMDRFAEKSGVSKAYISMLENGNKSRGKAPVPTMEKYSQIASAMDMETDELIRLVKGKVRIKEEPTGEESGEPSAEEREMLEIWRLLPEDFRIHILDTLRSAAKMYRSH